jgi:xanthine dehydrogenase YagR molybdenum-binding subunit
MAEYKWPEPGKRKFIGKRISRIDGPAKVSGAAKYTYDINRPGMLYAKVLRCPHAHAKIKSIDMSAAEKMPGVRAVTAMRKAGDEINWAGADVVAVAAVDEPAAEDAIRAIKVEYEKLPHLVIDHDPKAAEGKTVALQEQKAGDPDKGFAESEVTIEGDYGSAVITHCCLEPHGSVIEWEGEQNILAHISTQGVSLVPGDLGRKMGIPATSVRVKQDHIGGGFGSKFVSDAWDVAAGQLSKAAGGKPVKMMLERSAELIQAGMRPSSYAHVKIGAKKDGRITAWESHSWGTSGPLQQGMASEVPYVFRVPNSLKRVTAILNNVGPFRAWRAPNHPQACLITMSAIEDLAAKIEMDPLDLVLKNIDLTGQRAETYREELKIGADLIGWKQRWHPRGDKTKGPIKRGLGLAIHTWGGRAHNSDCDVIINADGSAQVKMGTQDLGTGTRTCIQMIAADTFGLPMDAIKVEIGDSRFPFSSPSGGSTTIGGISSATRRGTLDALDALFAKVAPALQAQPTDLEAVGGVIRVRTNPARSMPWAKACALLGNAPINVRGKNPGPGDLNNVGVGGVIMADVSVDVETGVVKINKVVCVQDCGLIINLKTAESQCYGALIMGVCYALYEEKIMDQQTGLMLNPNMEFYKLAGIGDVGQLVVHMMTGKGYDERGVIGLGEPPVIGPGAAISNAVANAIGVRVPHLPLTADRVLKALEPKGGNNARI